MTKCDKCNEQKMFKNMNTEQRLEEIIHWVTEDLWEEISKQSKSRVIKQLGFLGYPTEDLIKDLKNKEVAKRRTSERES